ncbi:MAG TPA: hypothetical protein VFY92_06170 [Hyphomicrobiaceae bacterium]|nr:hypothetical protein [Hyphomicrobiaceae bacterium]
MRKLATLIAGLALLVPVASAQTGPNGGQVAGSGHHQAELVVSPTELSVYWLEEGQPHDSKGTSLRAVVQQSGKATTISLADQDGKKLTAKLPSPLEKGAIVVLSGKDDHGERFTARYVIK